MIDRYDFGKITIGGKNYSSDVIIFPDKIKDNWWRKQGHLLLPEDLGEVVKEKPDILVVGTGYSGLMQVPESTVKWLKEQGIKAEIKPTREACSIFNRLLSSNKKVIAVLHLTC